MDLGFLTYMIEASKPPGERKTDAPFTVIQKADLKWLFDILVALMGARMPPRPPFSPSLNKNSIGNIVELTTWLAIEEDETPIALGIIYHCQMHATVRDPTNVVNASWAKGVQVADWSQWESLQVPDTTTAIEAPPVALMDLTEEQGSLDTPGIPSPPVVIVTPVALGNPEAPAGISLTKEGQHPTPQPPPTRDTTRQHLAPGQVARMLDMIDKVGRGGGWGNIEALQAMIIECMVSNQAGPTALLQLADQTSNHGVGTAEHKIMHDTVQRVLNDMWPEKSGSLFPEQFNVTSEDLETLHENLRECEQDEPRLATWLNESETKYESNVARLLSSLSTNDTILVTIPEVVLDLVRHRVTWKEITCFRPLFSACTSEDTIVTTMKSLCNPECAIRIADPGRPYRNVTLFSSMPHIQSATLISAVMAASWALANALKTTCDSAALAPVPTGGKDKPRLYVNTGLLPDGAFPTDQLLAMLKLVLAGAVGANMTRIRDWILTHRLCLTTKCPVLPKPPDTTSGSSNDPDPSKGSGDDDSNPGTAAGKGPEHPAPFPTPLGTPSVGSKGEPASDTPHRSVPGFSVPMDRDTLEPKWNRGEYLQHALFSFIHSQDTTIRVRHRDWMICSHVATHGDVYLSNIEFAEKLNLIAARPSAQGNYLIMLPSISDYSCSSEPSLKQGPTHDFHRTKRRLSHALGAGMEKAFQAGAVGIDFMSIFPRGPVAGLGESADALHSKALADAYWILTDRCHAAIARGDLRINWITESESHSAAMEVVMEDYAKVQGRRHQAYAEAQRLSGSSIAENVHQCAWTRGPPRGSPHTGTQPHMEVKGPPAAKPMPKPFKGAPAGGSTPVTTTSAAAPKAPLEEGPGRASSLPRTNTTGPTSRHRTDTSLRAVSERATRFPGASPPPKRQKPDSPRQQNSLTVPASSSENLEILPGSSETPVKDTATPIPPSPRGDAMESNRTPLPSRPLSRAAPPRPPTASALAQGSTSSGSQDCERAPEMEVEPYTADQTQQIARFFDPCLA